VPEHDRVDVWAAPNVTLVGVSEQVRPVGEADEVNVTVPVKPLTGVTVIVEVPAAPALTVTLVGLAVTVKLVPVTLNVTVAVRDRPEFVPVTITVNVPPDVKVHERVEVPVPVTLVGLRVHAALFAVRLTIPAKPLTPVTVMVEVSAVFALPVTFVGLATTVKSWTVKVTLAV